MKEALKFLNKPLTIRWYLLTTGYTTDEMAGKYFQNVSFTYYFTPRKFCWN